MRKGLHELDSLFRKVTLQNDHLKALVRDLEFHVDPVGTTHFILLRLFLSDSLIRD